MPNETPRTIAELQAWYAAHQLPPEDVTRFFIGKDIHEARSFGIYQDGDSFVVYKNKANGNRAVRYHGPDEAYAVNELYMRLKQEISNQKGLNADTRRGDQKTNRRNSIIITVVVVAFILYSLWSAVSTPNRGYYHYLDSWFYYQSEAWYLFSGDDWEPYDQTPGFADDFNDYYVGSDYNGSYGLTDFALSDYYSETDSDSFWDDSDSWDSGSTDWDSDW